MKFLDTFYELKNDLILVGNKIRSTFPIRRPVTMQGLTIGKKSNMAAAEICQVVDLGKNKRKKAWQNDE